MPTSQTGTVSMVITDASSEDWATIGVKVLAIALVPQGGGGNVAVYTAPTTVPLVNLAQPDQIAEILGNASVPAGTYTGAVLTISADPGHTQGMAPNLTASVKVNFVAPFNEPLHHRPLHDLTRPVPRHMYGDVTSIASDNASIMVTKEFPVESRRQSRDRRRHDPVAANLGRLDQRHDLLRRGCQVAFGDQGFLLGIQPAGQVGANRGALPGGRHAGGYPYLGQQPVQQRRHGQ